MGAGRRVQEQLTLSYPIRECSVQNIENYEYELPSDFEDEEIDEDAAFTEEDKKLYAGWFEGTEAAMAAGGNAAPDDGLLDSQDDAEDGEDAYNTDDFSEEVGPCPMPVLKWATTP